MSLKAAIARNQNFGLMIGVVGISIILAIFSPNFATQDNLITILRQVSISAIIAFGMTFVIIVRGIDLSVGAVMAVVGMLVVGLFSQSGVPLWIAILIGLAVGALIGFANGLLSTKLGLPGFIVTLAMAYIARGFALIYSDGRPIYANDEVFNFLGNGYFLGISMPIYYMAITFLILSIILKSTVLGKHTYATGGNPEAARFSGIDVSRIQIFAYTLAGFLAGLCGIIMSARLYSGQPSVGVNAELDAIAAVILGGASFAGGRGTLFGTLLGALTIGILNNGLNLLGVSPYWQLVVKGLVILIAIFIDSYKRRV